MTEKRGSLKRSALVNEARAWIRRKSSPAFKAFGQVPFEVSFRWWPSDEGYTTLWVCLGDITTNVDSDENVMLVGEFDDGRVAERDKRFHVDQLDVPGGNSWEIDVMLDSPLKVKDDRGEWGRTVGSLGTLLNAFLYISKDNVIHHGINEASVLSGRLVKQPTCDDLEKIDWRYENGQIPDNRWYYVPYGSWNRGQTHERWQWPGWLKPIPLFGQFIDPEAVGYYTDVDVDCDGHDIRV